MEVSDRAKDIERPQQQQHQQQPHVDDGDSSSDWTISGSSRRISPRIEQARDRSIDRRSEQTLYIEGIELVRKIGGPRSIARLTIFSPLLFLFSLKDANFLEFYSSE
jgi:hypothetical protein